MLWNYYILLIYDEEVLKDFWSGRKWRRCIRGGERIVYGLCVDVVDLLRAGNGRIVHSF
jgi:hypothetical protein